MILPESSKPIKCLSNKAQLASILTEWCKWKVQFNNTSLKQDLIIPFKSLKTGDIIFNRKMGFFLVQRVNHASNEFLIDRGNPELFRKGGRSIYFTHYSSKILCFRWHFNNKVMSSKMWNFHISSYHKFNKSLEKT